MKTRNGTITAHGRAWPLYERRVYCIDIIGGVSVDDVESAEVLKGQIETLLSRYGVKVKVGTRAVIEMSPEDQAEKNALDETAIRQAA